MENHPAVKFGSWLRAKRQKRKLVARNFAGILRLTPAEYTEVEQGIVRWLEPRHELFIATALDFDEFEEAEFKHLLDGARDASPLKFADIFTKEQLTPLRCCHKTDLQLTTDYTAKILDAVFTELTARNA